MTSRELGQSPFGFLPKGCEAHTCLDHSALRAKHLALSSSIIPIKDGTPDSQPYAHLRS